MIAHQESSQTGLISVIALLFAPSSLIAVSPSQAFSTPTRTKYYTQSIFSTFVTGDRSWIRFTACTIPITFVIVAVGFLSTGQMTRLWRQLRVLVTPSEKDTQDGALKSDDGAV